LRQILPLILRHSAIYGAGLAASRVISFLLVPLYVHELPPSEYGRLEVLLGGIAILTVVLDFGLVNGLFRSYYDATDPSQRRLVIRSAGLALAALALGPLVALFALAEPIARLLFGSDGWALLVRLALAQVGVELALAVPLAALRLTERPWTFTALWLTRVLLAVAGAIVLVVWLQLGVAGVLLANVVSATLALATFLPALEFLRPGPADLALVRRMLRFGLPLVFASLSLWLVNFSDRFFVQRLFTLEEVGIYALSYRVGMAITLPVEAFRTAWASISYSLVERDDAPQLYARIFDWYLVVNSVGVLALALFAREIIALLAPPEYLRADRVVPLVAWGYVADGAISILSMGISVVRRTSYAAFTFAAGGLTNVALNLLLIPRLGILGAALATLLAFVCMAALMYAVSQRYYPCPYDRGRVLRLALAWSAAYLLGTGLGETAVWSGVLRAFTVVGYLGLLFLVDGVPRAQVLALWQHRRRWG
jgi:O-antigen/teichoic acid export membrane protein